MLVLEAKLKNGTPEQYQKLDEAIRGAAEKVFRGGRVWGVGFYRFSGGQLPNNSVFYSDIFPRLG